LSVVWRLTLSEVRLLVPFLTSPSCPRAMDRPVIHPRLAYPWEPSVPLNCPRSIVTHEADRKRLMTRGGEPGSRRARRNRDRRTALRNPGTALREATPKGRATHHGSRVTVSAGRGKGRRDRRGTPRQPGARLWVRPAATAATGCPDPARRPKLPGGTPRPPRPWTRRGKTPRRYAPPVPP